MYPGYFLSISKVFHARHSTQRFKDVFLDALWTLRATLAILQIIRLRERHPSQWAFNNLALMTIALLTTQKPNNVIDRCVVCHTWMRTCSLIADVLLNLDKRTKASNQTNETRNPLSCLLLFSQRLLKVKHSVTMCFSPLCTAVVLETRCESPARRKTTNRRFAFLINPKHQFMLLISLSVSPCFTTCTRKWPI